jgi:hypothetical protein
MKNNRTEDTLNGNGESVSSKDMMSLISKVRYFFNQSFFYQ